VIVVAVRGLTGPELQLQLARATQVQQVLMALGVGFGCEPPAAPSNAGNFVQRRRETQF